MSKSILSAEISPCVSMSFYKLFCFFVTKQTQNVKRGKNLSTLCVTKQINKTAHLRNLRSSITESEWATLQFTDTIALLYWLASLLWPPAVSSRPWRPSSHQSSCQSPLHCIPSPQTGLHWFLKQCEVLTWCSSVFTEFELVREIDLSSVGFSDSTFDSSLWSKQT